MLMAGRRLICNWLSSWLIVDFFVGERTPRYIGIEFSSLVLHGMLMAGRRLICNWLSSWLIVDFFMGEHRDT